MLYVQYFVYRSLDVYGVPATLKNAPTILTEMIDLQEEEGIKLAGKQKTLMEKYLTGVLPDYSDTPLFPIEWNLEQGVRPENVYLVSDVLNYARLERPAEIQESLVYFEKVLANPAVSDKAKALFEALARVLERERDALLPVLEAEALADERFQIAVKNGLPPAESNKDVLKRKEAARQLEKEIMQDRLTIMTAVNDMGVEVFTEDVREDIEAIMDFKGAIVKAGLKNVLDRTGFGSNPLEAELSSMNLIGDAAQRKLAYKQILKNAERDTREKQRDMEKALKQKIEVDQEYNRQVLDLKAAALGLLPDDVSGSLKIRRSVGRLRCSSPNLSAGLRVWHRSATPCIGTVSRSRCCGIRLMAV
jgi:hypothetical protein